MYKMASATMRAARAVEAARVCFAGKSSRVIYLD